MENNEMKQYVVKAVAMIIAIASIVLIDYIRGLDSLMLVTGLLVAVIFIALRGKSSGLKRFYVLGGLALLLGVILSFSGLSQAYNLALFYGLLGIVIVISGAFILRHYLRANPLPAEENNE